MMKNFKTHRSFLVAAVIMALQYCSSTMQAQTPVAQNGALHISGNKLMNKNNQAVSFSGVSHFWSNDNWGGDKYYNAGVTAYFKNNWKATIIRVAMGVEESGGYFDNPNGNKARVKAVVDAAISNGMYVIIDWHTHHAENYRQQAIDFFSDMAHTYGGYDNVIYEIYNEPLNISWNNTIKPYANAVVGAIRAIDPDNVIIVGTPNWSQDVDAASADPIASNNIAYTLHFYAASHKGPYRAKASTALSRNVALFVTEWGTCQDFGGGFVDQASTNEWVAFMKANGISNCNWSINDKDESASILKPGTSSSGNWSDGNLSASGLFVKGIVSNWGGTPPACTTVNLPGTIQAESYCDMFGVQVESTSDSGGGQNVGYIDLGDWMAYSVNVPSSGTYTVQYRVASLSGGGKIQIEKQGGGAVYGSINVPNTGGWQTWQTISHTVQLSAGQQNIAIAATAGGFNINWVSISGGGGPFSQTIQAESFGEMVGVQTENTTDTGGGLNVGYIDNGDWMKYKTITIPTSGSYFVEYRVASAVGGGKLTLDLNSGSIVLGSVNIPNTGGWQTWTIVSHTVNINAGTYDFGIFSNVGGWNINWWRISKSGSGARVASSDEKAVENEIQPVVYPNPAESYIVVTDLFKGANQVSIIDLTGREISNIAVQDQKSISINIRNLNSGLHFVQVRSATRMFTTRFTKK